MKWWGVSTLAITCAIAATALFSSTPAGQVQATGVVFNDKDGDGKRDPGESGISGIRVSNGDTIVKTDREGRWRLPVDEDTAFFVIKPRGWMTPLNHHNLPQFYYIHKPNGSPKVHFEGVAPTGPLPQSIDFALRPQKEPARFKAIFFGDTQPRDAREVDYITHDVIEPMAGKTDAAFGVTLGDVVYDDLSQFDRLNEAIALIGIPWYNVLGNHDINDDGDSDEHSDETWERYFGPPFYSFEYGPTHFVVLDNVNWHPAVGETRGTYTGGFGETQLRWLERDLAMVPNNQLVVILMHIPLHDTEDKEKIFRLIEKRPYALSVSAHTHFQEHFFYTEKEGWRGQRPHHHVVNVTVCGSWWQGAPDERGIPHTTMRDGAPNGYSVFSFDGNEYAIEFRAAGRPETYQMNIYAPDDFVFGEATLIKVNVFGGNQKSKVEMRIDDGEWGAMRHVRKIDPAYQEAFTRESGLPAPYRRSPAPIGSPHLWEALTPSELTLGAHASRCAQSTCSDRSTRTCASYT
ncbi:MAG: calcineurin-like phosphoesterase family protein [Armatimonadota bacterium]|nr:calcineurin-like phosphoesterase family protein [Armatimonadota bacterium]